MVERFDHLELPLYPETYEREKVRGGPRPKPRSAEEKKQYFELQVQQFASIKGSYLKDKSRYSEYLDPNLIFKLEVTQSVSEEGLHQQLRRMDIQVLSPSPDKTGLWVVFAEDEDATKFHEKLQSYAERGRYSFFNTLGDLVEIPASDKIGARLTERMLTPGETAYLDVEIWRMEDERLNAFLDGLTNLIASEGGKVTDKLIKGSFCLLRIRADQEILKKILPLREIASVDRPPEPYIEYKLLSTSLKQVDIGGPPPDNATAIGVLDSGIRSGHPLLQNAVGDEIAVGTWYGSRIQSDKPVDDVGHGTKVAGLALYGDLKECIEGEQFKPEVWILSAKVMYAEKNPITGKVEAKYDEEELLEHQLEEAVRRLLNAYPNCRVVNLSLGDEYRRMFGNRRQFNLAALVDELARELKVVFVVSVGNLREYESKGFPDTYPQYLLEETEDVRVIDPATSALALTVGSITQPYGPLNRYPDDLLFSPADTHHPSPFTRVGPGYQGMIKPDVVEEGGNIIQGDRLPLPDSGGKLITLNPYWLTDGRLFAVDHGSSFSTAKVAHHAARLFNRYPNSSHNLIKALLIASARIPSERPEPFSDIDFRSSDSALLDVLRVYGYGRPEPERASFSSGQNVLLLNEKSTELDSIDIYYFYLPAEFVEVTGRRRLSVTLVYDPPVNKNRIDYMGCSMEFHLFRNMEVEDVVRNYNPIKVNTPDDEVVPESLKISEIRLHPGVNLRKKGVHQKGIVEYSRKPGIDPAKPLVLVVICRDRWIRQDSYLQDYAVVAAVEHSTTINLFNQIRARNRERVRVRIR